MKETHSLVVPTADLYSTQIMLRVAPLRKPEANRGSVSKDLVFPQNVRHRQRQWAYGQRHVVNAELFSELFSCGLSDVFIGSSSV